MRCRTANCIRCGKRNDHPYTSAMVCVKCSDAAIERGRANCRKRGSKYLPTLRAAIARDGMVCRWCGCAVRKATDAKDRAPDTIHLDHVIALARGGSQGIENTVVSCARCNLRRGAKEAKVS